MTQEIRSFVFRLRYLTELADYTNKAEDPSNRRSNPKTLKETLNDDKEPLYYELRSLHNRVQQLDDLDPHLATIWNLFHENVIDPLASNTDINAQYRRLQERFPINSATKTFGDTDLILFPDTYPEPLPLNGIRTSGLAQATGEYFAFAKKIRYDFSQYPNLSRDQFKEQILRDLRTLMSRPLGRELIRRILSKNPQTITISPSDGFSYTDLGAGNHQIRYGVDKRPHFHAVPGQGLRSLYSPHFVVLGHELIHMLHYVENESVHAPDPSLPHYYTNPEEFRTIRGKCNCHPPHNISEDSLRDQFSLFRRHTHVIGAGKKTTPDQQFRNAAVVGARDDLLKALPSASPAVIDESLARMAQRGSSSLIPIMEAAIADPSLRKGAILGALGSPRNSSSAGHSSSSQAAPSAPVNGKRPANPNPPLAPPSQRRHLAPTAPIQQSAPLSSPAANIQPSPRQSFNAHPNPQTLVPSCPNNPHPHFHSSPISIQPSPQHQTFSPPSNPHIQPSFSQPQPSLHYLSLSTNPSHSHSHLQQPHSHPSFGMPSNPPLSLSHSPVYVQPSPQHQTFNVPSFSQPPSSPRYPSLSMNPNHYPPLSLSHLQPTHHQPSFGMPSNPSLSPVHIPPRTLNPSLSTSRLVFDPSSGFPPHSPIDPNPLFSFTHHQPIVQPSPSAQSLSGPRFAPPAQHHPSPSPAAGPSPHQLPPSSSSYPQPSGPSIRNLYSSSSGVYRNSSSDCGDLDRPWR